MLAGDHLRLRGRRVESRRGVTRRLCKVRADGTHESSSRNPTLAQLSHGAIRDVSCKTSGNKEGPVSRAFLFWAVTGSNRRPPACKFGGNRCAWLRLAAVKPNQGDPGPRCCGRLRLLVDIVLTFRVAAGDRTRRRTSGASAGGWPSIVPAGGSY